ncbi:MAG: hypothetical protein LBC27_02685 [Spirochaetaceae bacterium]|nr:hypothetical protein [Spirochaetaceae bacterium]
MLKYCEGVTFKSGAVLPAIGRQKPRFSFQFRRKPQAAFCGIIRPALKSPDGKTVQRKALPMIKR